ncbi:MAG: cbb3-type cytochrome c oxidase subunit 3 [Rhodospirillales bacterium]
MSLTDIFELARSLWVVWLMILFGLVVWWAYRPKNRKRFEEDAKIPFKDKNGG